MTNHKLYFLEKSYIILVYDITSYKKAHLFCSYK